MKKILILTLLFLSFVCVGCQNEDKRVSIFSRPTVKRPENGRKDWKDVSSFICYYGDFEIEIQSQFDVVIMHSNTLYSNPQSKELVKELQDRGSYVISYITIGEDDVLRSGDGLGEGGYASYYIYENGAPKLNVNWNSYFVDAGNPVWQAQVINETRDVLSYGVDGIFMDTLDTVDIAYHTLPGMADLVKKLDETFPDAKFIANRGFTVLPYISQYIDGLMFESFNTTWNFELNRSDDLSAEDREYNEDIACNTINAIRRYDYFPIFVLDYINEADYGFYPLDCYNRSWQYDFIPYCTYDIHLGTPALPLDVEGNLLQPTSKRGELALSKLASDSLEGYNADRTKDNLAYVKNGAVVSVDSTFNGYNLKALNDGWYVTAENHVQKNWAKEAWASKDDKSLDHWIQFEFEEVKKVSKVVVHWANDNDSFYSPKKAIVQGFKDGEWVDLCIITNETGEEGIFDAFNPTWEFEFEEFETQKIRILQPKDCGATNEFGNPLRTGIMWVSEVEIFS